MIVTFAFERLPFRGMKALSFWKTLTWISAKKWPKSPKESEKTREIWAIMKTLAKL
jgi:hypothetical protein